MSRMPEQHWLDQLRRQLDASTEGLAPEVADRLELMRKQALIMLEPDQDRLGETALVLTVRHQLDSSVRDLPQPIAGQLEQGRRLALSRFQYAASAGWVSDLRQWSQSRRLLLPTGALAASFMVLMAVSLYFQGSGTSQQDAIAAELMLLASAEELELYENLDFYLWLEEAGFPVQGPD